MQRKTTEAIEEILRVILKDDDLFKMFTEIFKNIHKFLIKFVEISARMVYN